MRKIPKNETLPPPNDISKGINMKFKVDHDYHIHTYLSSCSRNPEQNPDFLIRYARENGIKTICITDHFWDDAVAGASGWYAAQNLSHIREILPFPTDPEVRIMFGCETELRRDLTLGISPDKFDTFDMIVIPTTHMHMNGFTVSEDGSESAEERAKLWVERLDAVLNMDLPFGKVGIAHLACFLINRKSEEDYLATIRAIPDGEMTRLFTKAAALGVGIELNNGDLKYALKHEAVMRMFHIAKSCGCKFYLGSDAHNPGEFNGAVLRAERVVNILGLTEDDKFTPSSENVRYPSRPQTQIENENTTARK